MNSNIPTTFPLLKGLTATDDSSEILGQPEVCETLTIPETNYIVQDDGSLSEVTSTEPTIIEVDDLAQVYTVTNAIEGATPGIDFEVHGDAPVEAINPALQQLPGDPTTANDDLKTLRLKEFKKHIEAELQPIISQAAEFHNLMATAKTSTKKAFYSKKFNKLSDRVKQYVNTLQQIEALINGQAGEVYVEPTIAAA